jgi:hypothetical protein
MPFGPVVYQCMVEERIMSDMLKLWTELRVGSSTGTGIDRHVVKQDDHRTPAKRFGGIVECVRKLCVCK